MQRNGQGKFLDHLINRRWDPSRGDEFQSRLTGERNAFVQKALQTRPVLIPLQFVMNAAGQTSPYRQTTSSLDYDVIITGIRSDCAVDDTTDGTGGVVAGGNRDVILERTNQLRPILATDSDTSLTLRVSEIAGKTAAIGGGKIGVFSLPSPLLLPARERITLSMFKQDTTAAVEIANVVLIGVAVYNKSYAAALLDPTEQDKINRSMAFREVPEVKYLKQTFDFDTAVFLGAARNLRSPANVDEPLLVKGLRTNMANSLITIGVAGQLLWTVSPTPIWALAAESAMTEDNYLWFPRPIYLRSGATIEIPLITNGTGTAAAPGPLDAQTGNTITWLCETV
jgi:hypothetical protein